MIRLLLLALLLPAHAGQVIEIRPGQAGAIQSAIDAIPDDPKAPVEIRLAPGTYREKIHVPPRKPPIRLTGDSAETTVITWADAATTLDAKGQPLGTFRSATLTVESADFTAENLAIENRFGTGSQALALRVSGDRATLRKVKLTGWQDTLLVEKSRQYFEDCAISGHVDFIFGGSTAWFERCTITCRGDGYITAASTPESAAHGLVFHRCRILAAKEAKKVFLGRPWQNRAATVFLSCELPAAILPAGWHNWNDPARESAARYGEHRSSGPGANPAGRVAWSRQLTDAEAGKLDPRGIFADWSP